MNEKLILRKIGNRYMIANTCSGTWDMAYVYTLNETAAFFMAADRKGGVFSAAFG